MTFHKCSFSNTTISNQYKLQQEVNSSTCTMFTDLYRQWIFVNYIITFYCKFIVHYNVLQKVSNLKWPSLQQYIKLQLFWHRRPICPFLTLNCGTSAGTSEAIFVILGNDFFSSLVQWYHDACNHLLLQFKPLSKCIIQEHHPPKCASCNTTLLLIRIAHRRRCINYICN